MLRSAAVERERRAYCTLTFETGMIVSDSVEGVSCRRWWRGRSDAFGVHVGRVYPGRRSDGPDSTLMSDEFTQIEARPGSSMLLSSSLSAIAALSEASESGFTRFGVLAAAVRLGGGGVEPGQRLRASGAAEPARRRSERITAELRRRRGRIASRSIRPVIDSVGWPLPAGLGGVRAGEKLHRVRLKDYATPVGEGLCSADTATLS